MNERVFLLLIPNTALWFSLKLESLLFNVPVSIKYDEGPGDIGRFYYSVKAKYAIITYFIACNCEYSKEFEGQAWHFLDLDV